MFLEFLEYLQRSSQLVEGVLWTVWLRERGGRPHAGRDAATGEGGGHAVSASLNPRHSVASGWMLMTANHNPEVEEVQTQGGLQ